MYFPRKSYAKKFIIIDFFNIIYYYLVSQYIKSYHIISPPCFTLI